MSQGRSLILRAGLIAIVIISPLAFGLVYPWGTMTIAGIIFLLAAIYPDSLLEITKLPKSLLLPILFVFAYLLIQVFFISLLPYTSAYELLKWLAAAVLFCLIQRFPRRESAAALLFVLALMGTFESLYGLFEVYSGREHVLWQLKESYQGFVTGTYFNRNHLAGFLELCLGVHAGFLVRAYEQKHFKNLCFWIISGLIVFAALLQSGSRMGTASFLFSLFFCMLFMKGMGRKNYWVLGFLAVAGTVFLLSDGASMLARFNAAEGFRNFEGGRIAFWKNAAVMLKEYALLGSGLGTFQGVFPYYQEGRFLLGWTHAHQDYLELSIELGIPVFLLLAGLFLGWIRKTMLNLESLELSHRPLVWGSLVSIISLALHGFADFNFAIPANTFLWIFILAAAHRLQKEDRHD